MREYYLEILLMELVRSCKDSSKPSYYISVIVIGYMDQSKYTCKCFKVLLGHFLGFVDLIKKSNKRNYELL